MITSLAFLPPRSFMTVVVKSLHSSSGTVIVVFTMFIPLNGYAVKLNKVVGGIRDT